MRIASFMLPKRSNDGHDLKMLHLATQRLLCEAFGGFTADNCRGGWRNPQGSIQEEDVTRYSVAIEHERMGAFRRLAMIVGRKGSQLCIMVTDTYGDIEFIDL